MTVQTTTDVQPAPPTAVGQPYTVTDHHETYKITHAARVTRGVLCSPRHGSPRRAGVPQTWAHGTDSVDCPECLTIRANEHLAAAGAA